MSAILTNPQTGAMLSVANGEAVERAAVPELALEVFGQAVVQAVEHGQRIAAYFGATSAAAPAPGSAGATDLYVVLADDAQGRLHLARTRVTGNRFPALTPACPQAHLFEREIAEQFDLTPTGHPWLKPIRFPSSSSTRNPKLETRNSIGLTDFYRVEGQDVHEVAVGPVHAGIIEPGHFRFQCYGETVFHLEISLGYQHRGVEEALPGGPTPRTLHYLETLAGDTTIGHASAYCHAIEALAGCAVPARAQALRGVALELERIANHVGDLGALAGDVGFLPTLSYCGRLRGDFLNMTAQLCGSRFGRGLVRPGGVGFDVDEPRIADLLARLEQARKDLPSAVNLLWDTPSVMARFEDTGDVTAEQCRAIGLVGPAARACGVDRDVRHDLPPGIYRFAHLPLSTWHTGDVFARAYVRWLEIQQSLAFLAEQLRMLPAGPVRAAPPGAPGAPGATGSSLPVPAPTDAIASRLGAPGAPGELSPDRLVVSLTEGWRGEICHVALTDPAGRLARYKIVDPSFHNWFGLALALRGQPISDFPLCNKSFNLSYCGHDL